jgi:hypothetical protein
MMMRLPLGSARQFLGDRQVGDSTVRVAYRGGDVSGFSAFVLRTIDEKDRVVLLSNEEGLKYEAITLNILRVLHGYPPQEPREYVADILRHAILSGGLDDGRKAYQEIRVRGLNLYNTDEEALVWLGVDLMAVDRNAEALWAFEIAAELYGDSQKPSKAWPRRTSPSATSKLQPKVPARSSSSSRAADAPPRFSRKFPPEANPVSDDPIGATYTLPHV